MRREVDERFAAYVRERGDHLLRVAVLLTGDWHAAQDLVQASLVKLYRAWPRLDTAADPDAYLRRIMVNTHRSWWRARWRREAPTAGIVATVAAITLAAGPATSAFAQVKHAATRTAEASYRVRSDEKIVEIGGLRSKPWVTAYGEFDPVHGAGEFTDSLGAQIRWVGGSMYVFLTGDLRAAYRAGGRPAPAGVSWERLAGVPLRPGAGAAGLGMLGVFPGFLGQVDPQGLLALLQSATDVRETGPASGPGWTGSAYTFSIATTLTGPLHTTVSLRGTVDVDQQGRVRELDGRDSFGGTVSQVEVTFGDFGLPVSVSPPPASQTWVPPGA